MADDGGVRPGRPSDFPEFARLYAELHSPLPTPSFDDWAGRLSGTALCLEEEGRLLGYVLGSRAPPRGHISQIVVSPDARGRGIGRRLMLAIASEMEEAGCVEWGLHVERENLPAAGLYRSLGMVETHRSVWVELDWSAVESAARGHAATEREQLRSTDGAPTSDASGGGGSTLIRPITPERDPTIEAAFRLLPGRLADCRRRQGSALVELVDRSNGEVLGAAALVEPVRLVSPLRSRSVGGAWSLLEALAPSHRGGSVRVVVDGDEALVEALRSAGGAVRFDSLHMKGPLARAAGVTEASTAG